MTPREMQAATEGYARRQRERVVMHPMSDFDSERAARRFVEGKGSSGHSLSPEEQQKKLDELKEKFNK
jgi:hypothetical protein